MSEIGDDILEAFQDTGVAYTVLRSGEIIPSDHLYAGMSRQVTKPFTREFFREAILPYTTQARAGDVIQFNETGETFLITNKTPMIFENEVIRYESVLYKCNVCGKLMRLSGSYDADYKMQRTFQTVHSGCYALITETLFGHGIESDDELARIGLSSYECYISQDCDARLEDRFEPFSGEYYRVESVKKRRFDNVWVLNLNEDTR